MTTIETFQFAMVKICKKNKYQYIGETVHQYDALKKVVNWIDCDVNKTAILRFIELLCIYLEDRFPGILLSDQLSFYHQADAKDSNFELKKTV